MSTLSRKCGLAILTAVLCLSRTAAHAQAEPVRYWIPFGAFGSGGTTGAAAYGDFPSFGSEEAPKGFLVRSFSAPVSSLPGGFGWNGNGGLGAFGGFGSLSLESTQFGYGFKGVGGLPMTVFGGVDALRYNPDAFSNITSFSTNTGTSPAYGIHGGVEIRPTSNLSLSFSAGYTQQNSDLADSDIRSNRLPGEPLMFGGRR